MKKRLMKRNNQRRGFSIVELVIVITSDKRGVAPMLDFLREGKRFVGYSAADRVVGKSAAMLFIKAGIKEIYAGGDFLGG